MLENTPLSNLWYGFKVFTGWVAFILSIIFGVLAFGCLFTPDAAFLGFILGFFSVGLTFFQRNLANQLELEDRRKAFGLDN